MSGIDGIGGASPIAPQPQTVAPRETEAALPEPTGEYGAQFDPDAVRAEAPPMDSYAASLQAGFQEAAGGIAERVTDLFRAGGKVVTEAADAVGDAAGEVRERIGEESGSLLDSVSKRAREIGEDLGGLGSVKDLASGALDELKDVGGKALDVLGKVGEGVSEVVDKGIAGAKKIGEVASNLIDTAELADDPSKAIEILSPGDKAEISLNAKVNVTPKEAVVAGVGITVGGAVKATVEKQKDGSFNVKFDGAVDVGVAGTAGEEALGVDGDVSGGGKVKGSFTINVKSPEDVKKALGQVANGEVPENLQSVSFGGGLVADISGALGVPEVSDLLGGKVKGDVEASATATLYLHPEAGIGVKFEESGTVKGEVAAVLGGVDGKVQAKATIEAKVSLPKGVDINDVVRDPKGTLGSLDTSSVTTTGSLSLSGGAEVGAGAGNIAKVEGGVSASLTIGGQARPLDFAKAVGQVLSGNLEGGLDTLASDGNKVFVKGGLNAQVGAEVAKKDLGIAGVELDEAKASITVTKRLATLDEDITAKEVRETAARLAQLLGRD